MDASTLENTADNGNTMNRYPVAMMAVLVGSIGFSGCADRGAMLAVSVPPSQTIERFTVSETEHGVPNWVLQSQHAVIDEEKNTIFLSSATVQFYEAGKPVSTLFAEQGRIDTATYDMLTEGPCVLTTAEGERIETSALRYVSSTKLIVTQEKVVYYQQDRVIYGKGMETSPDMESIVIYNQKVIMKDS